MNKLADIKLSYGKIVPCFFLIYQVSFYILSLIYVSFYIFLFFSRKNIKNSNYMFFLTKQNEWFQHKNKT